MEITITAEDVDKGIEMRDRGVSILTICALAQAIERTTGTPVTSSSWEGFRQRGGREVVEEATTEGSTVALLVWAP